MSTTAWPAAGSVSARIESAVMITGPNDIPCRRERMPLVMCASPWCLWLDPPWRSLTVPGREIHQATRARPSRRIDRLRSIGAVRELRSGVWHWEAQHPEWNERQWWGPVVSSYAVDDGARLVLFDPLAPPAEIEQLAAERETAIVLTCPWDRRDAEAL